jgi:hypothetical protein
VSEASPPRVWILRLSVILAALFNLLALVGLVHHTPILFSVFMFVGEPLFALALLLLLGAVIADLKARGLF